MLRDPFERHHGRLAPQSPRNLRLSCITFSPDKQFILRLAPPLGRYQKVVEAVISFSLIPQGWRENSPVALAPGEVLGLNGESAGRGNNNRGGDSFSH